ncbi:MAG: hypothetical protein L7S55_08925 [Luminiphilus sp.]|nr:hypothetical protein [Luminiphilus sp.]
MIQTIDDFLPAWLWYWIAASKDEYEYKLIDSSGGADKYEANLSSSLNQEIRQCYEHKVGKVKGHFRCSIVKAEPGYWYPEHADHDTKLVSSVLYLWPDEGDGTHFTTDDDVAWQINRLVTWPNEGQLHSYRNTKPDNRYTLNIYQLSKGSTFMVEET